MNKLLAILMKDTRLRFSSPSEWLFFLILPGVFTFVLGGGLGGAPGGDTRLRLLVVDEAQTPLSAELQAALAESTAVRAESLPLAEAEDEFAANEAPALLIIPADFDEALQVELRQQPNDVDATIAERAVLAASGAVGRALSIAQASVSEAERLRPFASQTDRRAYFEASLTLAQESLMEAPARLTVTRPETPARARYDPAAQASAGQLITWVLIPLLGTSGYFAYERTQGTLRRLLTLPTRNATFLLGAIGSQLAHALLQMTLLVLFGVYVMKLNWGESPAALALMLVTFGLASTALGVTLGTFVNTEGQANGLSIMLGMVMALLGGCWYPIELFPDVVRTAVSVLPTTWAMQGLLDLVLRGQGLSDILLEAGVLAGFAAVFFLIGVWRFRFE